MATDAGLQRPTNEDRVYVDEGAGVFLVVDGLGGHAAGEKAAETAVETIIAQLSTSSGEPADRVRAPSRPPTTASTIWRGQRRMARHGVRA